MLSQNDAGVTRESFTPGCTCPPVLAPLSALLNAEQAAHAAVTAAIEAIGVSRAATANDRKSGDFRIRSEAKLAFVDARTAAIEAYINWQSALKARANTQRHLAASIEARAGAGEMIPGSVYGALLRELDIVD